jgi:hypothetical protein
MKPAASLVRISATYARRRHDRAPRGEEVVDRSRDCQDDDGRHLAERAYRISFDDAVSEHGRRPGVPER